MNIASEGMGSWGDGLILHLIKLAFNCQAKFENSLDAKLLVRSIFFSHQGLFPKNIPYITWVGENNCYVEERNYPPLFAISSNAQNTFHIPYIISVFFELQNLINIKFNLQDLRLCRNKVRPYFLAYCASNSVPIRERLFQLLKNENAHGLGKCQTTLGFQVGQHETWRDNYKHYQNYRFTLAMENCLSTGYVTEKILNAILAGSIPIYYGDSNWVKKVFNEKAIIFVNDFDTLENCAEYIKKVDSSQELLEQYQNEPVFVNKDYIGYFSETEICHEYKIMIDKLKTNISF